MQVGLSGCPRGCAIVPTAPNRVSGAFSVPGHRPSPSHFAASVGRLPRVGKPLPSGFAPCRAKRKEHRMTASRPLRLALALACALCAAATRPVLAQSYVFTNFDGFGDHAGGTTIDGINNNGAEVGFSTGAGGAFTNFIRNRDGSFISLTPPLGPTAQGNGINVSNTVVGLTDPAAPLAFLLPQGGAPTNL